MLFTPPPQEVQAAPGTSYVAEASGEGAAAIAAMRAPEGFSIELFAAEPMLANPVVFHVDHAGDVYVCESFRVHAGVTDMRDHMGWLADELDNLTVADRVSMYRRQEGEERFKRYGTEEERVRLVRDDDGDGVADSARVFAGGFREPADGIAAGVLSYRGDVFYTCIPHLWRLRDRDGDGAAEERDRLSSGYGVHVALLGHDLHGLILGPDGRLWFSVGDRGFHVEQDGKVFDLPHSGAVLRCELDGSGLEVVHTGLRNPQELAFDDRGDLFTGDNNSDGGDRARWVQIVEGADSGWRFYYQYVTEPVLRGPWNDEGLWKPHHAGQPAYILPPIANLADGPSGLEHDPGTGLPERYRGHFFLCDFRGDATVSGVHAFTNVERGAGFELGPVEKLIWGTLVTDCQVGPDGALWFSDWTHGWNMTGKGRIYRLTSEALDDPLVRETQAILKQGVAGIGVAELEELLAHPDRRVRQEAHLELAWRGEIEPLARAATAGTGLARLHGIWGLGVAARRRNAQHWDVDAIVLGLLADPESEVRAQAAKVLGDLRVAAAGPPLTERLNDESARVQCQAALAIGRIGYAKAARGLITLAVEVGDSDPVLRHACVMGLSGSPAFIGLTGAGSSSHAEMLGLLVFRRMRHAALASFLDSQDPLLVREAATAIYDEVIEGALPDLAALIELTAGEKARTDSALVRRTLHANLSLGTEPRARSLARFSLRDDAQEAHRVEALALLGQWSDPDDIDGVLGCWRPIPPREAAYLPAVVGELAGEMAAQPEAVRNAWIALAATVRADVAPALEAFLRDPAQPPSTRAAAVSALAELGVPSLRLLLTEALADADGIVRAAALDALGTLDPAEALPLLAPVLEQGELAERRAAYRLLGAARLPEAERLLARELKKLVADLLPAELALDLVQAAEACGGAEPAAWLAVHRAPREADAALAPWLDGLFGGDAERGEKVFREKAEVSCLRCHRASPIEDPGVGPPLGGVGQRLSRLQLLESIAAPNRHVAAGYASETFFLRDGDVLAGRVIEESADAVAVVDANGAVFDVALSDVEERRPGLSAMPANLTDFLTREELRDLLEYLATLE